MKTRWISLVLACIVLLGATGCGAVQSAAEPPVPESAAALPEPENTPEPQSEATPEPPAPSSEPVVYETAQDYIDSLNADTQWVNYDPATNTATVTSIRDFVIHCKDAQKSVGAFDNPDNIQGENNLFGDGGDLNQHFDAAEGKLLAQNAEQYAAFPDWDPALPEAFARDLASTDSLGTPMETRSNMYNPMYYLCDYYDGAGTSNVAKYWRIRTGIAQTDTALTVEENLKLALLGCDAVESVDFATVWAQPHTTAERTGTSMENFIAWVNDCLR